MDKGSVMVTIYAYDKNGVYTNAAEVDPMGEVPAGLMTAPPALTGTQVAQAVGGVWVVLPEYPVGPVQPPQVPAAVTMRQARLALLGTGLLANIEAAIDALPSPQKEAARIEWEYSQEVQRHNGFVSVLAPMLGLTQEQIDALFIAAAAL